MNTASSEEKTGGCVCGANRYIVHGNPVRITVCHCLWCQKRTGTAFGTELVYLDGNVDFSRMNTKTYRYFSDESNRWLDIKFCPDCGTNLGFTLELRAGICTIPAGTLDNPEWLDSLDVEIKQVYTRSRRCWADESKASDLYDSYFNSD